MNVDVEKYRDFCKANASKGVRVLCSELNKMTDDVTFYYIADTIYIDCSDYSPRDLIVYKCVDV